MRISDGRVTLLGSSQVLEAKRKDCIENNPFYKDLPQLLNDARRVYLRCYMYQRNFDMSKSFAARQLAHLMEIGPYI